VLRQNTELCLTLALASSVPAVSHGVAMPSPRPYCIQSSVQAHPSSTWWLSQLLNAAGQLAGWLAGWG
jgi:hypothetical protein